MALSGTQATCDKCDGKSTPYKKGFLTGTAMNDLYVAGWTINRQRKHHLLCRDCNESYTDEGEEHF